jgi:pSer/pThr/pTyr-binding forkhead associated (FHA) protein
MNDKDRGQQSSDQGNARIKELTAALSSAERKLAEREALVSEAFNQTDAVRSQYQQAVERADALHRRLEAKEQQLQSLQSEIESNRSELEAANHLIAELNAQVSLSKKELQQRDSRVTQLEQLCAENENALSGIHRDMDRSDSAISRSIFASTGYLLESLDNTNARHRISRTTTTIGRASTNDISIDSNSISRYHARLVVETEGLFLVDLESTNGCKVNGQAITRRKLNDGDAILIGEANFRFTIQQASNIRNDDTANEKPDFDDTRFTRTVVTLNKEPIAARNS